MSSVVDWPFSVIPMPVISGDSDLGSPYDNIEKNKIMQVLMEQRGSEE